MYTEIHVYIYICIYIYLYKKNTWSRAHCNAYLNAWHAQPCSYTYFWVCDTLDTHLHAKALDSFLCAIHTITWEVPTPTLCSACLTAQPHLPYITHTRITAHAPAQHHKHLLYLTYTYLTSYAPTLLHIHLLYFIYTYLTTHTPTLHRRVIH